MSDRASLTKGRPSRAATAAGRSPKLTANDKHSVACHKEWGAWGERFGWRLYGSTDEHSAAFFDETGESITITRKVRTAIDRAMNPTTKG